VWPHTVQGGPLAGRTYASRREYRDALARAKGYGSEAGMRKVQRIFRPEQERKREDRRRAERAERRRFIRQHFPKLSRSQVDHLSARPIPRRALVELARAEDARRGRFPDGAEWDRWVGEWIGRLGMPDLSRYYSELFFYHTS
jgi:hypothetical protein